MDSCFFDAVNYDRLYNSAEFVRYFANFIGNGIFADPADGMQAYSKGGMVVGIKPGKCFVNGRAGYADGEDSVTLDYGEEGTHRYDAIVVRLDLTAPVRDIHIDVIRGDDADTLAAAVKPTPVREGLVYDLVLAYVAVGDGVSVITDAVIIDTRSDKSICGIVTGLVNNIDTTALFKQYEAQWELLKAGCAQDSAAVIAAWNKLMAVKTINGLVPTEGEVRLTQSLIPSDGTAYQMPYYVQSGTVTTTDTMHTAGLAVSFKKAYKTPPLLFITAKDVTHNTNHFNVIANYRDLTATGFVAMARLFNNTGSLTALNSNNVTQINWLAIGQAEV